MLPSMRSLLPTGCAPPAPCPKRPHRLLGLVVLCVAVAGCTSRTLPLPPPDVQEVSAPDGAGLVRVRGFAAEGAAVGIYNEADGVGVITSAEMGCGDTCGFEAELPAQAGDALRVWQFYETSNMVMRAVPDE